MDGISERDTDDLGGGPEVTDTNLPADLANPRPDNTWISGAILVGAFGAAVVVGLIYGTGLIFNWW